MDILETPYYQTALTAYLNRAKERGINGHAIAEELATECIQKRLKIVARLLQKRDERNSS